jgi:L-rhamnose-H+ transport protein
MLFWCVRLSAIAGRAENGIVGGITFLILLQAANMNPVLGVIFHWIGGFASGSFYVPYRRVRNWSWETYWLVGGFFSWIIAPWVFAYFRTEDLLGVIKSQSWSTLGWAYLFGAMWGMGGLTFGLTMRYLGLSLGMGVALGYCAAVGTLAPPITKAIVPHLMPSDQLSIEQIMATTSGMVTLLGVAVCLAGIGVAAMAGLAKEREMPEEKKKESIKEFNFSKGLAIATFSGVMSACFAFGLQAAKPMEASTAEAGTTALWVGLPSLVVVLLGGFTTNFLWCVMLNLKNKSGYEYLASQLRQPIHTDGDETIIENPIDAPGEEMASHAVSLGMVNARDVPLLNNYFFSALAGTTWYLQFFFYTMGSTQMGDFDYASWTLHMASIIIFSTLWGIYFREWAGSSSKVKNLIVAGIGLLVLSTIVIGWGAWLKDVPTAGQ